jgi:GR25 family glycosyltransferase involved in LPS biosynthesis
MWLRLASRKFAMRKMTLFLVALFFLYLFIVQWMLFSGVGSQFPRRLCEKEATTAISRIKLYYINLDESFERRAHMEEQAANFGFSIQRWRALRPTNSEINKSRKHLKNPTKGTKPTFLKGMLGIRKTNINLLKHLYRIGRKDSLYLVFEDDTYLSPYFQQALPCVVDAVPKYWDTIRFDCVEACRTELDQKYPSLGNSVFRAAHNNSFSRCHCDGAKTWSGCYFCGGGFATLYRHQALKKIISAWESYPIDDHDCELTSDVIQNYCVNWGLVSYTNNFGTTIPKNRL